MVASILVTVGACVLQAGLTTAASFGIKAAAEKTSSKNIMKRIGEIENPTQDQILEITADECKKARTTVAVATAVTGAAIGAGMGFGLSQLIPIIDPPVADEPLPLVTTNEDGTADVNYDNTKDVDTVSIIVEYEDGSVDATTIDTDTVVNF